MPEFSLNSLRYEDIRQGAVNFIQENEDVLGQFDFQGSNIRTIIAALSYFNMLYGYELTSVANSIFLDTTDSRKNGVSIAKQHGYRPKRKIASRLVGKFVYSGENFTPEDKITIPAQTVMYGESTGLPFTNLDPLTLVYESPLKLSVDFVIYQGEFKRITAFGTGKPLQEITIQSQYVDEYNLSVFVKKTSENDDAKKRWTQIESFASITSQEIYFVEEEVSEHFLPKVVFGNDIIGKIPQNTETLILEYLETRGSEGNGETGVTVPADGVGYKTFGITGFDATNISVVIPASYPSYGGTDNEDLADIKRNAPKFYSAAGRGVSDSDYRAILGGFTNNLKYFNVIGGNQLYPDDPKKLGISYITVVPFLKDNFFENDKIYLSEVEENALLPSITKIAVIATRRYFMKPTYLYFDITTSIEIPDNFTTSEKAQTLESVYLVLQRYYAFNLAGLGQQYRQSKLSSAVDNTSGVVSSNLETKFYFIINRDSFYDTRETLMFMPVIYKRDELGNIEYDQNQNAKTTNFIKRKRDIIAQENEKEGVNYDQYTLPIGLCSVNGKVRHKNCDRYIYNIDYLEVNVLQIEMIRNEILTYTKFPFYDVNNSKYVPDLKEIAKNVWNIEFNNVKIATMIRNVDDNNVIIDGKSEFEILNADTYELKKIGIDGNITVEKKIEVRDDGSSKEFFAVGFTVGSFLTDIRFDGKTRLAGFRYNVDSGFNFETSEKDVNNNAFVKTLINQYNESYTINYEVEDLTTGTLMLGDLVLGKLTTTINSNDERVFTLENEDSKYLKDFDLRDGIEIVIEKKTENGVDNYYGNLYTYDHFHGSSIASLNYYSGELKFKRTIIGYRDKDLREIIYDNIRKVFDNYDETGLPMDKIKIIPDTVYDSKGLRVGELSDMDGLFNQSFMANINYPTLKVV